MSHILAYNLHEVSSLVCTLKEMAVLNVQPKLYVQHLLFPGDFCPLLITFANSADSDQTHIRFLDLAANCLTL